jgi:hypothetical protein
VRRTSNSAAGAGGRGQAWLQPGRTYTVVISLAFRLASRRSRKGQSYPWVLKMRKPRSSLGPRGGFEPDELRSSLEALASSAGEFEDATPWVHVPTCCGPRRLPGGIDDKPASLPDAPWEPLRDEHRGNNQHEPGRRV